MSKYAFGDIAINSTEKKKPESADKAMYIGLEHLDSGCLTVRRFGADVAPIGDKLVMKKGDVLFGKRRAYQKKVAIAPFDGIFSAHGMVLRPKTAVIDKGFFPLFIASDYFLDAAIKISVGSLSPTINWSDLKRLEFSLPPLDEQKKLAQVLWSAIELKEAYQVMLARCDEMASSRFMEMFKTTDRIMLSEIAIIIMGQSPSSETYNTDGNGLPFYQGCADFGDKYVEPRMYCSDPTRLAQAGDVLMSVRAPVGCVNITKSDCCIGRGLAAIRNKKYPDCNDFLLYAFRVMEQDIAAMGQGSTVLSINKDKLYSLVMPDASQDQQNAFISFVRQIDKSKVELQKSIASTSAMIKSLLSEAMGE